MNIIFKQKYLLIAIVIAAFIPMFLENQFYLNILILILIYGTVANGWNVLSGYGGQLSLGHAFFFGLGAYISSLLFLKLGISPWVGLIIAIIVTAVVAIFIGLPTFRLKGPFFTLATIAVAEVIRNVALYWRSLTNGSMGVNIPFEPSFKHMVFDNYGTYYWLALILFLLSLLLILWIDKNKIGYYLRAIREDQDSAETLGINTLKYKLIAMVISAGLTGAAGVLYAQFLLYFEPNNVFDLNLSVEFALIVVIGGIGTVYGPLLGAAIVIPLSELMRATFPAISGMNFFVYGVLLVIIVTFLPDGLLPSIKKLVKKVFRKRSDNMKIQDS